LATGDFGGTVRLWNLQTTEAVVLGSHRDAVISLAFSPDGKRLASSSWDHTVKLWDVATPGESATLRGHATRGKCVAFAPDGRTGENQGWPAECPSPFWAGRGIAAGCRAER